MTNSLIRLSALIALTSTMFWAGTALAQACQDGVDCRCDVLVETYGDEIVFCEDFENPRLTEKGVWQQTPSSLQGAGWKDQGYTSPTSGCGFCDMESTCIPQNTSSLLGTGGAQIVNVDRCIELNTRDRQSVVPSLNAENQVFDGNVSYAALLQPASRWGLTWTDPNDPNHTMPQNHASGFQGNATLDRRVKNFGITRATMVTPEVYEEYTNAWKDNAMTKDHMSWFGTWNGLVANKNE